MTKNKTAPINYAVAIVGGGPAGVATGLTLNALGISNCLIEAANTPIRKFGEALPPNAKPLLKQLGILSLVEDPHHMEYYGNKSCWGTNQLEQKEFISEVHGPGFLLDRLHFERQLLEKYKEKKGILYAGNKLKSLNRVGDQVHLTIDDGNRSETINCQMVVDATGRKASVCRHFGMDKIQMDTQFALSFSVDLHQPIKRQILIEATPNGWWYAAPNGEKKLTVMYFTLKHLLPPKDEVNTFLQQALKASIYLSKTIPSAALSTIDIKIMPAGTSRLDKPFGDHWVAVGDAAFSYDPISSYGITSALASGYYAGQAIASKLAEKPAAMDAYRYVVENAFQAYMEKLIHQYEQEGRWANDFYWKHRFAGVGVVVG